MDIKTPFGFSWPVPTTGQALLILLGLVIALALFLVVRYIKILEQKRINDYQLFLFQMKRRGLSNFQIKILNNMVTYLRLSAPTFILKDPDMFESSLSDFIHYLRDRVEPDETMDGICRDMILIYEKLYQPSYFHKPLESMSEIDDGLIVYFTTGNNTTHLAKVIGKDRDTLSLRLFHNRHPLGDMEEPQPVSIHILRVNDAEYLAKTTTVSMKDGVLSVALPGEFIREREFRHPYINVIIPVVMTKVPLSPVEDKQEIRGTIFRLNEYEGVVRSSIPIEYQREYVSAFELMEYRFNITCRIIASRTVEEEDIYYYTLKFMDTTEAAKNVLTRFITDHM